MGEKYGVEIFQSNKLNPRSLLDLYDFEIAFIGRAGLQNRCTNLEVFMKMFGKAVSLGLCVSIALASTACDEDEIAAGVAGAVIGAAIVHGVNSGHGRNQCSRPREVCSTWYDSWGQYHRECRVVRSSCYRTSPLSDPLQGVENSDSVTLGEKSLLSSSFRAQLDAQGLTEEDFAKEYSMSFESAKTFIDAMDLSRSGNSEGLRQLGLVEADLQEMAQYKLPSAQGISLLASKLNMRADTTTGMLNRIRAWALTEKTKICAKPEFKMNGDEKKLCNVR
jgi:hypothetical protein